MSRPGRRSVAIGTDDITHRANRSVEALIGLGLLEDDGEYSLNFNATTDLPISIRFNLCCHLYRLQQLAITYPKAVDTRLIELIEAGDATQWKAVDNWAIVMMRIAKLTMDSCPLTEKAEYTQMQAGQFIAHLFEVGIPADAASLDDYIAKQKQIFESRRSPKRVDPTHGAHQYKLRLFNSEAKAEAAKAEAPARAAAGSAVAPA